MQISKVLPSAKIRAPHSCIIPYISNSHPLFFFSRSLSESLIFLFSDQLALPLSLTHYLSPICTHYDTKTAKAKLSLRSTVQAEHHDTMCCHCRLQLACKIFGLIVRKVMSNSENTIFLTSILDIRTNVPYCLSTLAQRESKFVGAGERNLPHLGQVRPATRRTTREQAMRYT